MDRSTTSPTATALVGRDHERGRLDAVLDAAGAGRASTVLVHGDAGVGKTSLVRAAAEARTEGVALYGAGLPLSSLTVPLLAIRSLVRELPDGVPPLDLPTGSDVADALVCVDAWLDALAKAGPVALVLDDLHWADQTSLDVLQYVVAGPEHRALSIVATVRSGAVTDDHPLTRWLADVRRLPRVDEIALAPLDKASTLDQLTNLLGETPHGSLVDEVYTRTGGNPYFTRLIATGLRSDARSLPTAMPGSLHDALVRTASSLSAATRRGAQVLAVGGHPATYDELDEVAPDLAWDAVVPEAVAAGVVDALPGGRFWIHHPLLAETMEAEMPGRERRARHQAFAQWWERQPPLREESAEAARVAQVADHYFHAKDTGMARTWALRAAEAAESAGTWSEAQRLLERELAHDPLSGSDGERFDLLNRARAAAEMSGDLDAELALVEELMAHVDPMTQPLAVADLIVRRASVRHLTGRTYVDGDALEHAEALARSRPPSTTLVRTLAWSAMHGDWKPATSAALSEEAVTIAREIGAALGAALTAKTVTAFVGGDATASIACAADAVSASVREGDWPSAARSAEYRTCARDGAWSPWFAEQIARDREHLVASGAPQHEIALFDILEADARLWVGEWEACVAILRSCMATRLQPMWDAGGRLTLAHLAARQGRPVEATSHLVRAEELVIDTQSFYELEFDSLRALVALAAGDPDAAYAHAVAGLDFDGLPPNMVEYLLPLAARALADRIERRRAAGDDADDLLRTVTELAATHRHIVPDIGEMQPWTVAETESIQALYRAELARATSSDEAILLWRVATIRARRACLAWDEAYAGWRWAEALLRAGEHGHESACVLRDTYALARRLGAAPIVSSLERLAASAHVSLAAVTRRPDDSRADDTLPGLTPRENEIVAHLVAGRTYAEIAEALVVSEKTVSSHVSNVLRKTGTKNRVELAILAQHRTSA